jgi:hypothetical protein
LFFILPGHTWQQISISSKQFRTLEKAQFANRLAKRIIAGKTQKFKKKERIYISMRPASTSRSVSQPAAPSLTASTS